MLPWVEIEQGVWINNEHELRVFLCLLGLAELKDGFTGVKHFSVELRDKLFEEGVDKLAAEADTTKVFLNWLRC